MAKITWLGEDELHANEDGSGAGPSFTVWGGVKFPKDVAVETRHAGRVSKAQDNPFFRVEDAEDVDVVETVPAVEPAKRRGRPPKA